MTIHTPAEPIDAIVFDCDGTLSQIEGINWLATQSGVADRVHAWTAEAMGHTGITADLYSRRLKLIQPTAAQVRQLGEHYYACLTPGAEPVVSILQHLGKPVYVISAGLMPAVLAFARRLQIPDDHVDAVDIYFDSQGDYSGYDQASSLIEQTGKRVQIQQLKKKYRRVAFVGDGMNDVQAASVVTYFIGYGGTFFRKTIAAVSHYYIVEKTLLPVLPLVLTAEEQGRLLPDAFSYCQQGTALIEEGKVLIKSDRCDDYAP